MIDWGRKVSAMSSPSTPITSYQDLVKLLSRDGVAFVAEPQAQTVRVATEMRGIEGQQLIRWQEDDGVVQFIQSMPIAIPPQALAVVESTVARLNHQLAVPGLDLNHAGMFVAYRVTLPMLPRHGVMSDAIRACFRVAVKSGSDLVATLQRVIAGTLTPADAVADARREILGGKAEPAAASAAAGTSDIPAVFPSE